MSNQKSALKQKLSRLKNALTLHDLQDIYRCALAGSQAKSKCLDVQTRTPITYHIYADEKVLALMEQICPAE